VPKRTPEKVRKELLRADRLFWVDLLACMTALRRVVEVFLDTQRIPRRGHGRRFLSLDSRIARYVKAVPTAHAQYFEKFLHAIRESGNEGAHATEVQIDDIQLVLVWIREVLQRKYPESDPAIREAVRRHRRRKRKPP
jgi:hypothetical protein